MKQAGGKQPLILLVDELTEDSNSIKNWLNDNSYQTQEAANIFEAIEEISDFTVRECPDVILLSVNPLSTDLKLVEEMFDDESGSDELPVYVLSKTLKITNKKSRSAENIGQLQIKINEILPKLTKTAGKTL